MIRGGLRRALRRAIERVGIIQGRERDALLLGRLLAGQVRAKPSIARLADAEFRVFSQFGDDGILQWLVHHVRCPRTFIEFGVENYRESNTRFLLMNDDWSGLVLDGSPQNVAEIVGSEYFWRHDLTARAMFVTRGNIDPALAGWATNPEVGVLSIDVDGNDYWIWQAITTLEPVIVVVEYNSVFGPGRAITVPYADDFARLRAHPSGLYFGASLRALSRLGDEKGYALVGSNSAGNNAYFIRRDRMPDGLRALAPEEAYVRSSFRESRDGAGRPTFVSGDARLELLRGLPVVDVETGATGTL